MLLLSRVPDTNLAGLVGGRNVEAGWTVFGNCCNGRMLRIHIGVLRVLDVSDDHIVAVRVEKILSLRIAAQNQRSACW